MSGDGTARLTLPAQPEFVSVARLTLAGIAARLGFDVEQVEDIRIAVAEAMTLLLPEAHDGTRIELAANWTAARFEIEVGRDGGPRLELEDEDAQVAVMVLEALMDTATFDVAGAVQQVTLGKARG